MPPAEKEILLKKLLDAEQLATGGVFKRLSNNPAKYLMAVGFHRLAYPHLRKGINITAKTFFGAFMNIRLPAATDIFLTGAKSHPSEIRLARFMIQRLREGDCFLDAGAHYGFFSLLAARLTGPSGVALAVEAAAPTFNLLKFNAAPYGEQIITEPFALSDRAGEIIFYEFPLLYSEYNTTDPEQFKAEPWFTGHPPRAVATPATTIDLLLKKRRLQPAFIKMDLEGGEFAALQGGVNFLTSGSPVVVIEYLVESRRNSPHRQAADLLHSLGFFAYVIDAQGKAILCADIEENLTRQKLTSDNIVFIK